MKKYLESWEGLNGDIIVEWASVLLVYPNFYGFNCTLGNNPDGSVRGAVAGNSK